MRNVGENYHLWSAGIFRLADRCHPGHHSIVGYTDDIDVYARLWPQPATHIKAEHVTRLKPTLKRYGSL